MKNRTEKGMTLIETLVAITILSVAIVAPMTLTMQSLAAAYYARDQVVSFYLAQEAIESVRSVRDNNILRIALNEPDASCTPTNLLCGIPIAQDFIIDSRNDNIDPCGGTCPVLETDGNLYGYDDEWDDTLFRRTVYAEFTDEDEDEVLITVTVTREGGVRSLPPFVLQEHLYRWVNDGSGE
jgi:prepilin-type N-terminal cleavage/methylation domain-containing protein